ncbi:MULTISPECIES: glycosyltransferase family 2 protein [Bizionia]|uniref:Glycosyltransferase family 2 protein n=1 Tax=Bizionia algoritergicola TaxID=291187 RepID=A0A5D0QTY5_9FLAO|nr:MULTISPECIES: glycosyltransferase family 2 protein [Bizionia]OBX20124.1 glycosyl transferase family 2 [Bizionia sp. APA-3]TYB72365.1 glycosyltransferase family 2 protein [Bizionia algoritergicola]
MKIAVVILNWNGQKLLEQFLPAVMAFSEEATIYVADNASTDDSVHYIKENFPEITIIENSENGGYAKGYNDALIQVEEDIYCLLNSDVEVTENWLKPILTEFVNNSETAIIQPKILDYKNKAYFEYAGAAGGFIDKYGYPFCRGRVFNAIEKDNKQYNDKADIFWASGACFFIRKSVFKTLGGFDESFFAHMEEIDLCWRAFNQDLKTVYIGKSTVFHVGGATLKNTNPKKTYLNFRNSLFTLTKNASGNLFLLIFTRLLLDGVASVMFLFTFKFQHILAVLKAHLSFYKNLPTLLKKRHVLNQKTGYFKTKSIVWDYHIKGLYRS